MKKYRCVFTYATGHTTIEVTADSAERALSDAAKTIGEAGKSVEVWDETGLVIARPAVNENLPHR